MANKQKGEIPITVDGKEYVLFLGTNALEMLEQHFSTPDKEVGYRDIFVKILQGQSLTYMKAAIWAALQEFQPGMSQKETGALIDAAGGIETIAQQMGAAMGLSMPTDSDLKALGISGDRPRTAQGTRTGRGKRTGTRSSAMPGASV